MRAYHSNRKRTPGQEGQKKSHGSTLTLEKNRGLTPVRLFLLRELLLSNVTTPQLNVEHTLHRSDYFLVWRS